MAQASNAKELDDDIEQLRELLNELKEAERGVAANAGSQNEQPVNMEPSNSSKQTH